MATEGLKSFSSGVFNRLCVTHNNPVDIRRCFNVDTTLCDIVLRRIDVEATLRVFREKLEKAEI